MIVILSISSETTRQISASTLLYIEASPTFQGPLKFIYSLFTQFSFLFYFGLNLAARLTLLALFFQLILASFPST